MLSDRDLAERIGSRGWIEPFEPEKVRLGSAPSYGLSTMGYDLRLGQTFRFPDPDFEGVVDAIEPPDKLFLKPVEGPVVMPPHSFVLAHSFEMVRMPRDVGGLCVGKSTNRRMGLICETTPLEPGWHGQVTFEINNSLPVPIRLHPLMGIVQVLFFPLSSEPVGDYRQRGGKYQGQLGVTPAR